MANSKTLRKFAIRHSYTKILHEPDLQHHDRLVCRGVVFYVPSPYTACDWFWTKSNLCGLPAMMIAAPIGAMFGGIIGWRLTGPSKT
jgi:hypothetical protein